MFLALMLLLVFCCCWGPDVVDVLFVHGVSAVGVTSILGVHKMCQIIIC
jgi:hypothetical protein